MIEQYCTTTENYDDDYDKALSVIAATVDLNDCDGNQRNWCIDALNDSWVEGISITEWVNRAMTALGIVPSRTQMTNIISRAHASKLPGTLQQEQ